MGVTRDPVFGPVAMFGWAASMSRCCAMWSCAAAPLAWPRRWMIRSICGFALLRGVRGQAGANLDALATMLSRLSQLAVDLGPGLRSIDVNPVIATTQGAWAVDAVIEIDLPEGGNTGEQDEISDLHPALAVHSG
jgi:acyl-CoA synthetase (NDP forming)